MINKKEATISSTIVTKTLFLNSKLFCILFDSGATHSFISIRATLQLNLEKDKELASCRISWPNGQMIE